MDNHLANRLLRFFIPLGAALVLIGVTAALAVRELPQAARSGTEALKKEIPAAKDQTVQKLFFLTDQIDVSIETPRGICLNRDGDIVVSGSRAVEVLTSGGVTSATYRIAADAECAASDGEGRVYLGTGNYVTVLDTASGSVSEWSVLDKRSIITSLAVSGQHVFVADAGTAQVWVFDRLGMLQNIIDGFLVPSPYFDVDAAAGGGAWVVDPGRHTVARFNAAGYRSVSFGKYSLGVDGFPGCCNPTNITLRPDGSVVTSEKGLMRLKLFSEDGRLLGVVAVPDDFGFYDAEVDLVSGTGDEIYVLSPLAGKVFVFEVGKT